MYLNWKYIIRSSSKYSWSIFKIGVFFVNNENFPRFLRDRLLIILLLRSSRFLYLFAPVQISFLNLGFSQQFCLQSESLAQQFEQVRNTFPIQRFGFWLFGFDERNPEQRQIRQYGEIVIGCLPGILLWNWPKSKYWAWRFKWCRILSSNLRTR